MAPMHEMISDTQNTSLNNNCQPNKMTIETKNLKLIPCDTEILKAAIQGNEILAKKIQVTVQENWTEFELLHYNTHLTD